MPNLTAWAPRVLSLLRIMTALLYMEHGTQKMLNFPIDGPGADGTPLPPMALASGILEIVLGALVALGLFTRPAAFIASGHMAAAYFIAHAPQSFWPVANGGDASIMFCFAFLYLAFAGPGPWSLDTIVRKKD
jgi:putative oxidoreductase